MKVLTGPLEGPWRILIDEKGLLEEIFEAGDVTEIRRDGAEVLGVLGVLAVRGDGLSVVVMVHE